MAHHVCTYMIPILSFSWINPFSDRIPSWLLFHGQHFWGPSGIQRSNLDSFRAGEQPAAGTPQSPLWAHCFLAWRLSSFFWNPAIDIAFWSSPGFVLELFREFFVVVAVVVKGPCLLVCVFVSSADTLAWLPQGARLLHQAALASWQIRSGTGKLRLGFGLILELDCSVGKLCLISLWLFSFEIWLSNWNWLFNFDLTPLWSGCSRMRLAGI